MIVRRQNRKFYLTLQEPTSRKSNADTISCSCNMPNSMDTTKKSLTSLPDELLLEIVSSLNSQSLKNLRSTCGRFWRIVNPANIKKLERKEELSQLVNQIFAINCILGTGKGLKDIEERIEQAIERFKPRPDRKDEEQCQERVEEFTAYLEDRRIREATCLLTFWIVRLVIHTDTANQARSGRPVDGSLRRRISDIRRSIREGAGQAKRRWKCYMRRLGVRRSE